MCSRTLRSLCRWRASHAATSSSECTKCSKGSVCPSGRAIIHRPPLLLADEPTGNLDSRNGDAVLDLLQAIHEKEKPTIVLATHSDRAAARGSKTIHIEDGKVRR